MKEYDALGGEEKGGIDWFEEEESRMKHVKRRRLGWNIHRISIYCQPIQSLITITYYNPD